MFVKIELFVELYDVRDKAERIELTQQIIQGMKDSSRSMYNNKDEYLGTYRIRGSAVSELEA